MSLARGSGVAAVVDHLDEVIEIVAVFHCSIVRTFSLLPTPLSKSIWKAPTGASTRSRRSSRPIWSCAGSTPAPNAWSPPRLRCRSIHNFAADLHDLPSVTGGPPQRDYQWQLEHADGQAVIVPHVPRLVSDDMAALCGAALRGGG